MSDLISRRALMKRISEEYHKHGDDYDALQILGDIEDFPSAESTGAMDEAIQEYIKDGYMQPIGEDLISRQDAVNEIHKYFVEEIDKTPHEPDEDGDEVYTDMPTVNSLLACNKELSKRIKSLPSEENESRLYIKIYADDEPSVKAEKLYQICDETQNREVAEWLKEYFPSVPDSRQRGEWIEYGDNYGHSSYFCSRCGTQEYKPSGFCPNCGCLMTKGD